VQNLGAKDIDDLRLRTDLNRPGQSATAQVATLRKHRAGKVFREVASGAKADRTQLRRLLDQLDAGDVVTVTRLDRLARSTRDLLNTLAAITGKKAGFKHWRHMGGHDDIARAANADRARRAGG
jgi:DNA invertase Pin-like site-specific DNA recombinase